jgi:hypothetical protein
MGERHPQEDGGASEIRTDSTVADKQKKLGLACCPLGYLMRFVSVRDPGVTQKLAP